MDYLDPQKRRRHSIRLFIGYILLTLLILCGTVVLVYLSYGFRLDKGKIVQNGLVFVSSNPTDSSLYIDNELKEKTDVRLNLPAGTYSIRLQHDGYRSWQRDIKVVGGAVRHFDYPFLFPSVLSPTMLKGYAQKPTLMSQSVDKRWVLVGLADTFGNFEVYNTDNLALAPTKVNFPAGVLTPAKGSHALAVVEWSKDGRYVLMKHTYGKTFEYVQLDRQDSSKSLNVTKTLQLNPSKLTLFNGEHDRYYAYNAAASTLNLVSLKDPAPRLVLEHVLEYSIKGTSVLYTSTQGVSTSQLAVRLYQNNRSYLVRALDKGEVPLLGLSQYGGSWYTVVGVPSQNSVYVYQDAVRILEKQTDAALAPLAILNVPQPKFVSFSPDGQYVMAQHGTDFAVYDVRYDDNYRFSIPTKLDAPQKHAFWMDSARLAYVSGGRLVVMDYDGINRQVLMEASAQFTPLFTRPYKHVLSIMSEVVPPNVADQKPQTLLMQTPLRVE